MKIDNQFDRMLELNKGEIPLDVHLAAVYVNDTLELAWRSAQSVFEERATPQLALEIYDRINQRIAAERFNQQTNNDA